VPGHTAAGRANTRQRQKHSSCQEAHMSLH
jgi:hypothetical protein